MPRATSSDEKTMTYQERREIIREIDKTRWLPTATARKTQKEPRHITRARLLVTKWDNEINAKRVKAQDRHSRRVHALRLMILTTNDRRRIVNAFRRYRDACDRIAR